MRNEADRLFQIALAALLVAAAVTVAVMLQGRIGEALSSCMDNDAPLCVQVEDL